MSAPKKGKPAPKTQPRATEPVPAVAPAASATTTAGFQDFASAFWSFFTFSRQLQVLAIIGFLLYANTLVNEYAVDDGMVIEGNKFTTKGFAGINELLTKDSFLGNMEANVLPGGRYRPLSYVTFAIEWELFGRNPLISHLGNVFLYLLTLGGLLYFLQRCLLPQKPELGFMATLIFAIHPMHIEAVTNIKGRDEVLALVLMVGALIAMWHSLPIAQNPYRDKANTCMSMIYVACGAFFLSLLAKENPITFLAIIPLMIYCFTELDFKKALRLTTPFLITALAYIFIRLRITGFNPETLVKDVFQEPYLNASFEEKYATIVYVLGIYLKLLFYPMPMSFDYSFNQIPYIRFSDPKFMVSFLIYGLLTVWSIWAVLKKNIFAFAVLFYLLSISIVSNIVFNLGGVMGERFLYQPSLGFAIAVAALLYFGYQRLQKLMPVAAAGWVIVAGLSFLTLTAATIIIPRNTDWKSNETLYVKDVHVVGNSAKANKCAAEIYLRQGMAEKDTVKKREVLLKADYYLKKSIAIYPTFEQAYLDLAATTVFLGRIDSADRFLDEVDQKFPNNQYANAYRDQLLAPEILKQGLSFYGKRDYANAIPKIEKVVKYRPNAHDAWYYLGHAYGTQLKLDRAVQCFQQAVKYEPKNSDYWFNLGGAALTNGQYTIALDAFEKVKAIKPTYPNLPAAIQTTQAKLAQK
jgi:protein O-mannosyl-transferase